MKLISNNKKLIQTFTRLIESHSEIQLAVAWASAGNSIFELLHVHATRIKRAVIGTHFYQTHPDVLDVFQGKNNARFVLQTDGVFHPKLYLFQNKQRWAALIGSANLTTGALTSNSEAMILLEGSANDTTELPSEIIALIDQYWETGKRINAEEAAAYREVWNRKQPALRRLSGQYGISKTSKPVIASSVMSMSWPQYVEAVKKDATHGFDQRCELLRIVGEAFAEHQTFQAMDRPTRKTIAGLPNDSESRWGWFGSMKGAGYFHQAVNDNNSHLSRALDQVPLSGIVTRDQYWAYVDEFVKAFPNGRHGVAIASRLLALKRPDQFVCLDSKNQSNLCANFGIVRSGMTYERYWDEIVERILDAPWWNVPRPRNDQERALWNGRAAMLDAIFYEE